MISQDKVRNNNQPINTATGGVRLDCWWKIRQTLGGDGP